jgi:hypothetical protein
MGKRLTVRDMKKLMKGVGIKGPTADDARRVLGFLKGSGVLVPTGQDRYELGPMMRFQEGEELLAVVTAGPAALGSSERP